MDRLKLYLTCIASYLTGWTIAQATYNRMRKHVIERDWEKYKAEIAHAVADVVEERNDPLEGTDRTTDELAHALYLYGELIIDVTKGSQTRVSIRKSHDDERLLAEGYGFSVQEAYRRAVLALDTEEGMGTKPTR